MRRALPLVLLAACGGGAPAEEGPSRSAQEVHNDGDHAPEAAPARASEPEPPVQDGDGKNEAPAPAGGGDGAGASLDEDEDLDGVEGPPPDPESVPKPEELDALMAPPTSEAPSPRLRAKDEAVKGAPPKEDPRRPVKRPGRAEVGGAVFAALKAGDVESILAVTPLGSASLAEQCSPQIARKEIEARLRQCRKAFDWSTIQKAAVNGGEPTPDSPPGCKAGVQALEPLVIDVLGAKGKRWAVELYGTTAREGAVIGFSGRFACKASDGSVGH